VIDEFSIKQSEKLLKRELNALTLKSVNEVVREYKDTLERYIVDASNGNLTAAKFAKSMRSDVIDFAERVYAEGLREGGSEGETSSEDEKEIRDWILSQTPHIYDLADDAVAVSKLSGDEKTNARDVMLDRAQDWTDQLALLGQLAYVNAQGDPMLTMKRDGPAAKDPCATCAKWDGQRHRKSFWDDRGLLERNGNDAYECGRWDGCNHHFYFDNGDLAID
jgi:hypothetical protein